MNAIVVGTGFGARVHVPALRAAGFDVAALVGVDVERTGRRAARAGVPRAFGSLGEALDALPGAAVTVATPPDTHCPLVLEAVAAGRPVLCEKPFALDAGEAARMLAAASEAGVVHVVGHEFRFAADRAAVARALAAGAVGTPRIAVLVQLVDLVADPGASVPSWWFDPARGGGWLGASGSHAVDQVRHWLGEFEWVAASLPPARDAVGAEDSFAVLGGLRTGCAVALVQSAAARGAAVGVTRVVGDRGTIWVDGGGAWLAGASDAQLLAAADTAAPSDDPRHRFTHLELGPYTELCRRFATAIREGGSGAPAEGTPTFADGLAAQRVLDAIRASAAAGGRQVAVPTA